MTLYKRVEDLLHQNFNYITAKLTVNTCQLLTDKCVLEVQENEDVNNITDVSILNTIERIVSSLVARSLTNQWSDTNQ
ncbi:MAG: hypothetical protein ACO3UU_16525 [Minisyncoccia bacterium]